jgi:hypothetical protein
MFQQAAVHDSHFAFSPIKPGTSLTIEQPIILHDIEAVS